MIDQNVCDRVIQHVCKHKPYAPMLLGIYEDHIHTVYCSTPQHATATKPIGLGRHAETLFAGEFTKLIQAKGQPLFLAQAGIVSSVNDVWNPNLMHVCITTLTGMEHICYTAKLKSCLCCFDTLAQDPGWKNLPFMLHQAVLAFRPPEPLSAPVYCKPSSDIKFSKN